MTTPEATLLIPDEVATWSLVANAGLSADDTLRNHAGAEDGERQAVPDALMANALPVHPSDSGGHPGSDALLDVAAVTVRQDGPRGFDPLSGTAALPDMLTEDGGHPRSGAPVCAAPVLSSDSDPDHRRNGLRSSSVRVEENDAGDGLWRDGTRDTTAAPASSDQQGEIVQRGSATHSRTDELALLHASLGHYARELLDIQKLRIAQGNRIGAMERDGLPDEFIAFARDTYDTLKQKETALNAYLGKQARRHFLAPWIAQQRGIGLPGFARLLGITGPLDRFATISKLWAYLGMHTVDGISPRKRRGERANWSHQGRVLCFQIGESIVKVGKGGEYREAYDRKKQSYTELRPEWTPAHRHAAAQRYAVKLLLKRIWLAWRAYEREAAA